MLGSISLLALSTSKNLPYLIHNMLICFDIGHEWVSHGSEFRSWFPVYANKFQIGLTPFCLCQLIFIIIHITILTYIRRHIASEVIMTHMYISLQHINGRTIRIFYFTPSHLNPSLLIKLVKYPQRSTPRVQIFQKTSAGCSPTIDYFQLHSIPNIWTSGPRLNIKTVLSTYGDFHVKDKTAVRTSYL